MDAGACLTRGLTANLDVILHARYFLHAERCAFRHGPLPFRGHLSVEVSYTVDKLHGYTIDGAILNRPANFDFEKSSSHSGIFAQPVFSRRPCRALNLIVFLFFLELLPLRHRFFMLEQIFRLRYRVGVAPPNAADLPSATAVCCSDDYLLFRYWRSRPSAQIRI